jgi:hypothetical protein
MGAFEAVLAGVLRGESWEASARRMGIPADRAGLVKRNIELKTKLDAAVRGLTSIAEAMHLAYDHGGEFVNCDKPVCASQRDFITEFCK